MNTQTTLTLATLTAALAVRESLYLSTNPVNDLGVPLTASADLRKGAKYLTAPLIEWAAPSIEDHAQFLRSVETTLSVKAIFRMCQFWAALHSGNTAILDRTTALETLSSLFAGAHTRSALHFAATGKGDENTSDQVKGISTVRKLQKALGQVGATTEQTQNSRTFGKGGFARACGMGSMTKGATSNELSNVNAANGFVVALVALIEKTTESTLTVNMGKKVKGAK